MTNFARLATVAATLASVAVVATPTLAAPVGATTPATAKAQIVRPLTLTAKQNLDFGTIVLTAVTGATSVAVATSGAVTCGAGLTCSGTPKQAIYNVAGTNNQVVKIFSATSNLVNANDSTTIVFTPALPTGAAVTLTNSGAPGTDFNVGGSIAIATTTTDGVYTGNMNVTVDYN